jgi:hypothetical protein
MAKNNIKKNKSGNNDNKPQSNLTNIPISSPVKKLIEISNDHHPVKKHLFHGINFIHDNISFLNTSKIFAGVAMILLNIGSKVISIQFSQSAEEYLKMNITKDLLVFAMAWLGTRDIYTALFLAGLFILFSDYLFNDKSSLCIVPHKYRVTKDINIPENQDDIITDKEINEAIIILEKARKEKEKINQKNIFSKYYNYQYGNNL